MKFKNFLEKLKLLLMYIGIELKCIRKHNKHKKEIPDDGFSSGCNNCKFKNICKYKTDIVFSKANGCNRCDDCKCNIECTESYSKEKGTIILLDNNPGITKILKGETEFLLKKYNKENDFNIMQINGSHCAFCLEKFIQDNSIKVDGLISALTIYGSILQGLQIIKYNGVDVLKMCKSTNPNLKYFFYTSNKMNLDIKENYKIYNSFKEFTNEDIKDYILYKSNLGTLERREKIEDVFKDILVP